MKINWFNSEIYFLTGESVKRQITGSISKNLTDSDLESKFPPGPRWKSRIHARIYKRHSTAPVVNKKQCLYWTVGTGPRAGAVLARYSPRPETKCRLTSDSIQVTFQSRAGGRPCLCQHCASTAPVLQILLRYWRRTKPVVNKEQCLYWTVGTGPMVGTVLA